MTKSEIASDAVKEKYAKILKENGIAKAVKEVIIVQPDLKGEHMCSACDYVTVKFEDDTNDLELFTKRPTSNEIHNKFIREMGVFEKESTFFNMLLPDTRKFCEQKTGNADLMKFFPKSYYGDDSLIVLENLIPRNYFMLDKEDRQDYNQAKLVLENLARFHGVFHAFINDMGLEEFNKKYPFATKEAFYKPESAETMGPAFENHIINCIRVVKASEIDGSKEAVEWLEQFSGNIYYTALCESVQNDPSEILLVLSHGDCWNNNMMFLKDDTTQEIIDHILIDLQILRYGSPNLDIGYFLFTSVKPSVRREKLQQLLKAYFDVLIETTEKLGSSVNVTFDEFVTDYKKKCTLGFFNGLAFLSAIGAMKDVDLEGDCGTNIEEMTEYFNNVLKNWFESNPEKASKIAEEIINQINEYKNLISQ